MNGMEDQIRLFEIIKSKIPKHQRLADVIEELLGVGSDSAYRRIRGSTELSFSELKKICSTFNLSIDEMLNYNSSKSALFHYTPVDYSIQSYIDYIIQMADNLSVILKSSSDKELISTAQDIPFYHFFKHHELALFRLFAWSDTINNTSMSYCDFCTHLEEKNIISVYKQIHNTYICTPSKEIWNDQTVDTTLRLLEYYYEAGAFDSCKDTTLMLLDRLDSLMDMVKQYADCGYKDEKRRTQFALYHSSVDLGNNLMLARDETKSLCAIRLYLINRIITDNELLCYETEKWINSLISKSILISGDGAFKERYKFFQLTKNKIDGLRNKISS